MAPADDPPADFVAGSAPQAADGAGLKAAKKRLRAAAKEQRARAAAAAGADAGGRLCEAVLSAVEVPAGAPVSGFWPMGEEIDPVPTLEALYTRGHPIGLPTMPGKHRPLAFRAWRPGLDLQDGGFGTRVPPPEAAPVTPRVLLVPLLVFDRAGYRLGYGGGFYDRTLAELRAGDPRTLAVGVAYAGQEVDAVPHDANDQRLDAVITERGPVPLSAAGAG